LIFAGSRPGSNTSVRSENCNFWKEGFFHEYCFYYFFDLALYFKRRSNRSDVKKSGDL
jgi:hypothetical protein